MKTFKTVPEILEIFIKDMKTRNILKEGQPVPEGMDLALKIMNNYIVYPVDENNSIIPLNYCMLERFVPKMLRTPIKALLSFLC